ncbi:PDZ domain-containing protein [Thalassoglobus sp. JC818]|uniref:PDZ domain-containing protein n=1 Tax=Thalassoglobus sp. JC818 TaxID=3232136 RepID=UPI0034584346
MLALFASVPLLWSGGKAAHLKADQPAETDSSETASDPAALSEVPENIREILIFDSFGRPRLFRMEGGRPVELPPPGAAIPFQNMEQAVDQNRIVIGAVLKPLPEGLHGLLGIEEGVGFLIIHVLEDGPAAQAGILEHDLLLELDSTPIRSIPEFREIIERFHDREMDVKVRRKQEVLNLKVRPVTWSQIEADDLQRMEQEVPPEMEIPGFAFPDGSNLLSIQSADEIETNAPPSDHSKHDVSASAAAEIHQACEELRAERAQVQELLDQLRTAIKHLEMKQALQKSNDSE